MRGRKDRRRERERGGKRLELTKGEEERERGDRERERASE